MLFQSTGVWRPTRQANKPNQAAVAKTAGISRIQENGVSKPGAKRSTLSAVFAGQPVCMANQTTQMTKAQAEKNSSVNQSTKADRLRRSVGKAKAAKVAKAGRANNRARSRCPAMVAAINITAMTMRGCNTWPLFHCWRHCHRDHKTKGHAGQLNHTSKRAKATPSPGLFKNDRAGQRNRPKDQAKAKISTDAAAAHCQGLAS